MRTGRGRWLALTLWRSSEHIWQSLGFCWKQGLLITLLPMEDQRQHLGLERSQWHASVRAVIVVSFWVQACGWGSHTPGWGAHSWEWNLKQAAKWFAVLLNDISPGIFSDTRNKIITCFGSSFCTLYSIKSGLDEVGRKAQWVQGFPSASKTKEAENTDVCSLQHRLVD